jgi:ABC-2 type transport system permease protein
MNALLRSARLGLERSWIETKQFLRNPQEMVWMVMMTVIFVVVLWFQRNKEVEGMSLALLTLPSLLGMLVAQAGFSGTAGIISYDREDGTLLRAKAIPQGIVGYIVARTGYLLNTTVVNLFSVFIPALFFVDGLTNIGIGGIFTILWLFLLGLFATAPFGSIIGSLVKSSSSGFGLTFLPLAILVAISGIFYPITALAGWIQGIAQAFPVYWLGHGFRSVFLPDTAAAELQGSWELGTAALVLTAWAIVGFIFAPRVLRRMARKESGSNMQANKEKVMQRGY